jgi:hypothetical protein
MKTRQELILDFMLALASNINDFDGESPNWIYFVASQLADEYLENV